MKKYFALFIATALVLMFVTISTAQEKNESKTTVKWGLGVSSSIFSISSLNYYIPPYQSTAISIPIYFSNQFKIEPFVDYGNYQNESKPGSIYDEKDEFKYHTITIGSGIFYSKEIIDTRIHFGTNIGYVNQYYYQNYEGGISSYSTEHKGNGILIAPSIGGEYFFSNHFSLGSEVRFEWSELDSDNSQIDSMIENKYKSSTNRFTTSGLVFVRFYIK
jgi:hypothetical protein